MKNATYRIYNLFPPECLTNGLLRLCWEIVRRLKAGDAARQIFRYLTLLYRSCDTSVAGERSG